MNHFVTPQLDALAPDSEMNLIGRCLLGSNTRPGWMRTPVWPRRGD